MSDIKIENNLTKSTSKKKTSKKSGFVKDTTSLVTGNALAQFITIALTPVITRLFSPEAFGEFSILMALSAPFVAIASLRYHEAIMLPDSDDEAQKLFQLASSIVIVVTFIITIAVFLFYERIAQLVGIDSESYIIYGLPCIIFLIAMRRVFDSALQRKRMFKRIAVAAISVAIFDRAISITFGLLGYVSAWVLMLSRIFGLISSVIWMLGVNKSHNDNVVSCKVVSLSYVASRYKNFALYSWSGFIQQLDNILPMILLASVFGVTTAGLYALARRVLIEPFLLVGEALSKTYYQKAAEVYRMGSGIADLTVRLVGYLFKWIIPPAALLACVAPEAFALIFGEEWRLAGSYSIYLIPWFVAIFIMQPLVKLFNILEKQKEFAFFTVWRLIGTVIILVTGFYTQSPEVTFALLSLLIVVLTIMRGGWILRQIGVKKYSILPLFINSVVVSILCIAPLLLLQTILETSELIQVLFSGFIGTCYIVYLVWSDPRFNKKRRKASS